MGSILPIKPGGQVPVSGVKKAKNSRTTEKVAQFKPPVVQPKSALGNRQVALLKEVKNLARFIQTNWNSLELEDLAEKIIDLENKVSLLPQDGVHQEVDRLARRLHFKFVFPIAAELEVSPKMISFAKTVLEMANRILKSGSVEPFKELNSRQQYEVMRGA